MINLEDKEEVDREMKVDLLLTGREEEQLWIEVWEEVLDISEMMMMIM